MKIQTIAVLTIYLCSAYGDEVQPVRKEGDLVRELEMSEKKAKKLKKRMKKLDGKSQKLEMDEVPENEAVPSIEMEEIESVEDEAEGDAIVVFLEELEEVVEELTEELVAVETDLERMNPGGVETLKTLKRFQTRKPTGAKTSKPTSTKTKTPKPTAAKASKPTYTTTASLNPRRLFRPTREPTAKQVGTTETPT
jgi:hypothetical protein